MTTVLISLLCSAILMLSYTARSEPQYPSRPVKLVVPYGAGGAPDVLARILAKALGDKYGQQFYVVDEPGAGGVLGANGVVKAEPDGYTLLFSSEAPLVIDPLLYKDIPYEPLKDLAPITQLVRTAFYVNTCPTLPVSSIDELAGYGRGHLLTYASSGYGTTMQFAGEMLKKELHFDMTHVPYRTVPAAMSDIMSCQIDVGFGAFNSAYPLVKAGKLKALAVSSTSRRPETPNVPTLRELGLQDLEQIESSFSLLGPAKTPRAIINLLHDEFVTVMNTDEIQKDVYSRGMTPMTSTPEEFTTWIVDGTERYRKIIQAANIVIK
ncbi:MAG TPA: tripartite tricarboxylate transporter substrate binding protein [Xanthobacteraceae bacterium]|jgi:tripartite-type tricarboxylate transporter receptor subunit TctC